MNTQETFLLIDYVGGAYPSWKPSEGTVEVWEDLMGGYEYAAVKAAVREYIRGLHEFPPAPGQIVAQIEKDRPLPQPTAEEVEYMNAELPVGDEAGRIAQARLKARYGTNGIQPTTETRKKLEPARERTGPLRVDPRNALPPREEP